MDIKRGDIFYVEKIFGSRGCEIEGGRPAVVVSNDKCNMFSGVVEVVFLTSKQKKDLPTHVEVICQNKSTALCEQIHSVSVDRLGQWYKTCTDEEMKAIDEALMISLQLEKVQVEHEAESYSSKLLDEELQAYKEALKEVQEENKLLKFSKEAHDKVVADQKAELLKVQAERDLIQKMYGELLAKVYNISKEGA
jgi:mRNA interferase MazF